MHECVLCVTVSIRSSATSDVLFFCVVGTVLVAVGIDVGAPDGAYFTSLLTPAPSVTRQVFERRRVHRWEVARVRELPKTVLQHPAREGTEGLHRQRYMVPFVDHHPPS